MRVEYVIALMEQILYLFYNQSEAEIVHVCVHEKKHNFAVVNNIFIVIKHVEIEIKNGVHPTYIEEKLFDNISLPHGAITYLVHRMCAIHGCSVSPPDPPIGGEVLRLCEGYKSGDWIFVAPMPNGDFYQFISLLGRFWDSYCTRHQSIFIIYFIGKEIPSMFSQFSEFLRPIFVDKNQSAKCSRECVVGTISPLKANHIIPKSSGILDPFRLILAGKLQTIEYLKYVLGLPMEIAPDKPDIPEYYFSSAMNKLQKYEKTKKRIMISPHAKSIPTREGIWEHLARKLTELGYDVLCDTANGCVPLIPGTIELSFTMGEAVPIANEIGIVILALSGLSHIISSSSCRLCVVYPKQMTIDYHVFDLRIGKFRQEDESFAFNWLESDEIIAERIIEHLSLT
ncbi:hypothetical protein [Candidatus Magnetaquicoccus inordinatus]|uniref:hypothetical protein n=1 Tax=Candidatus Magnetaquicoccus inordinatus TaxID=2496818 RepID=UPI00102C1B93|nr:hypothetical protein [Candidatus Magnetaquicoccus inordinatus]